MGNRRAISKDFHYFYVPVMCVSTYLFLYFQGFNISNHLIFYFSDHCEIKEGLQMCLWHWFDGWRCPGEHRGRANWTNIQTHHFGTIPSIPSWRSFLLRSNWRSKSIHRRYRISPLFSSHLTHFRTETENTSHLQSNWWRSKSSLQLIYSAPTQMLSQFPKGAS